MDAQYGYCSGSEIKFTENYESDLECLNECTNQVDATGCSYHKDLKTCSYFTTAVRFAAGQDGVNSDPDSSRNICWIIK